MKRKAFTLIELLVVIAIIAILIALLIPAVQKVREAASRAVCINNLKQVTLACHSYHGTHNKLPQNYYGLNTGQNPLGSSWSWISQILPYLDQGLVYDAALLNNGPAKMLINSAAAAVNTPIPSLRCPSDPDAGQAVWTDRGDVGALLPQGCAISNYKGVSGQNWQWGNGLWNPVAGRPGGSTDGLDVGDGALYRSNGSGLVGVPRAITFASIKDGMSNTFLVGESLPSVSNWTGCWCYADNTVSTAAIYPNSTLTTNGTWGGAADGPNNRGFHSAHPGGLNFALCDGSVMFVGNEISMVVYRGAATIQGRELIAFAP